MFKEEKGDSPLSLSVLLLLLLLSLLLLLWYAEPRKSRTPNIDRERERNPESKQSRRHFVECVGVE